MIELDKIKKAAAQAFEDKDLKYLIGYQKGINGLLPVPAFIRKPDQVKNLIWEPTCIYNLTSYLLDEKNKGSGQDSQKKPVGIIVKGCDSRALSVLIQEKFIKREDVFVIGVSCENTGVVDKNKITKKFKAKKPQGVEFDKKQDFTIKTKDGNITVPATEFLAERCLECQHPYPKDCDVLIGEEISRSIEKPYKSLEKVEALSTDEKWAFWKDKLDTCIRCYACRSVCPLCYCEECTVDSIKYAVTPETSAEEKADRINWIEKSTQHSENLIYHMVRALHLAGRCVDCQECERVCPENIPIRLLNKKMEKIAKNLFDYESGTSINQVPMFSTFREEDPEDFIY